jgi:hypothetical protein
LRQRRDLRFNGQNVLDNQALEEEATTLRNNGHILKVLIVKLIKAAGVQCEEQNSSFVYAMCYTKCAWMYAGTKPSSIMELL